MFPLQIKLGVEKVLEALKTAGDKEYKPIIPNTAVAHVDVLPEMVGYVLGSR